MNNFLNKAKLITILVDNENSGYVLELIKEAGAPGCTKMFGQSYDESSHGELLWTPKNIMISLVNEEKRAIVNAITNAAMQNNALNIKMMIINACNVNASINCDTNEFEENTEINGSTNMEPKMNLVSAIVRSGHTEEIMIAARQAGAQGGTVINAHGTGTEEDAKFFGISLAPEKEILIILTKTEQTQSIIEIIKSQPIFQEPGGGIIFTLNVEDTFVFNNKA